MKITELHANSVRGLPAGWPEQPIGSRGLVVLGGNGTGKSSLVDAIEYALKGESTLYDRNRQNVSWVRGSAHVRTGTPDISLTAVDETGETHTLTPEMDLEEIHPELSTWVRDAKRSRFVLRRWMLLKFILAPPADRYSELEPFLDLDAYSGTEEQLHGLLQQRQTLRAETQSRVNAQSELMRRLFEIDVQKAIQLDLLLSKVNKNLRVLGIQDLTELERLSDTLAQVEAQRDDQVEPTIVSDSNALITQFERIEGPETFAPLAESLSTSITTLEEVRAVEENAVLVELLIQAEKHIHPETDTCPVCEQPIEGAKVLESIRRRSDAGKRVQQATKVFEERKQGLQRRLRQQTRTLVQCRDRWISLYKEAAPQQLLDWIAYSEVVLETLEAPVIAPGAITDFQLQIPNSAAAIVESMGIIREKLATYETEASLAKKDAIRMLTALQNEYPVLQDAVSDLATEHTRCTISEKIYQHVVKTRQEVVQQIVNEVSETANTYYEFIHPGESIATTELGVREAARASITLLADFYGNHEDPLLHFSESHLDTLGIAYFLAFRRRQANENPRYKVLILDDVLHSVDAEHRRRMAQLLNAYFSDHQILITTHDPVFYQMLRQELGGSDRTFIRINGWDIDRGPILADPTTDLDKIQDVAIREALPQEDLAAICGRIMELICRRATEGFQINIIARFDSSYTINDLWPPLLGRLRRQQEFNTQYGNLLDSLEGNRWIRNACGAHYNEDPIPPSPTEVQELASGLSELWNAFNCERCNSFVHRSDNNTWACTGAHKVYRRRLEPTE